MKKIKFILSTLMLTSLFFIGEQANAQLTVDAQGEVGIGTATPLGKLNVNSTGTVSYYGIRNLHYYSGATTKYGLYNYTNNAGTGSRRGLYNLTYAPTSGSGSNYGLYNATYGNSNSTGAHRGMYNYGTTYSTTTAYGSYNYLYSYAGNATRYGFYNYLGCGSGDGTGVRYALYSGVSTACDGGTRYAGYFNGNVYVAGTVTQTSDASKKKNVEELTGALDIIDQLKPKTYDYIDDADLSLPTEKQFGFLAQDLEQVLPSLVKDVETFAAPEEVAEGEERLMGDPEVTGTIKSVNYMALIPVLVEAIQEQQAEIDALKAELAKK